MSTETVDIIVKESGSAKAAADIKAIGTAADQSALQTTNLSTVMAQLTTVLGALGISLALKNLLDLNDEFNSLIVTLAEVSTSTDQFKASYESLRDTADSTGQSLSGTVDLFASMSKSTQQLGIDSTELTAAITTMSQAMALSGQGSAAIDVAMSQLSRAMATGTLSGRELQQVFRQFPELSIAVANGMGMSVAQFQKAAQAGTISAAQIVQAMQSSAGRVKDAFDQLPLSIDTAMGQIRNALVVTVGQMDTFSKISTLAAESLSFVAKNMGVILPVVMSLAAGLSSLAAYFGIVSLATSSFWSVLANNPLKVTIFTIVTAISLFAQFGNQIKLTSDGSVSALGVVVGAFNLVKEAIMNAAAIIQANWVPAVAIGTAVLAAFTAQFLILRGIQIAQWLITAAQAAAGFALAIASASLPTVALVASLTGIVVVIALVSGKFDELKAKVSEIAGTLSDKVSGAFKSATEQMSKTGDSSKDLADTFGTSFNDINASLNGASTQFVDTSAVAQRSLAKIGEAAADTAAQVRDAMGNIVSSSSAMTDWAIRSGEAFTGVAGKAAASADQISNANEKIAASAQAAGDSMKWMATWTSGGTAPGLSNFEYKINPVTGYKEQVAAGSVFEQQVNPLTGYVNYDWVKDGKVTGYANGGSFEVGGTGGTDSQMVQFMATPGERVHVLTPTQQRSAAGGGAGGGVVVNMNVVTSDADSFARTQRQVTTQLQSALQRVALRGT